MNTARIGHKSFYINDFLYVIGGASQNKQYLKSCEVYDIVAKKWYDIAPMNQERTRFGIYGSEK